MDRHEYEINQLINPKKDIVKSNSKHRDKIETLIQGRRIGGIVGGEEPPKNILENGKYKIDISSGAKQAYAAFDVRGGNVYVYASSLEVTQNVFVYGQNGNVVSAFGNDNILELIENDCKPYDNYVSISRRVVSYEDLENFDTYKEL